MAELDPIKKKIMSIRATVLKASIKNGPKPFYMDVLEVLEAYDDLETRCTTLEWMLEAEGKLVSIEDYNKHTFTTGGGPTSPPLPSLPTTKLKAE